MLVLARKSSLVVRTSFGHDNPRGPREVARFSAQVLITVLEDERNFAEEGLRSFGLKRYLLCCGSEKRDSSAFDNLGKMASWIFQNATSRTRHIFPRNSKFDVLKSNPVFFSRDWNAHEVGNNTLVSKSLLLFLSFSNLRQQYLPCFEL